MGDVNKISDNLRRQCSRREYCRADVLRKAEKALDGDRAAALKIVEALVQERYVDDLRYASAFARDKSSIAGWGPVKIRYMLSAKGISKDVIAAAMEDIDRAKADDRLAKLLTAKYRALKGDPQCRMKLLRFALGRGYSYDEVNELMISFHDEDI